MAFYRRTPSHLLEARIKLCTAGPFQALALIWASDSCKSIHSYVLEPRIRLYPAELYQGIDALWASKADQLYILLQYINNEPSDTDAVTQLVSLYRGNPGYLLEARMKICTAGPFQGLASIWESKLYKIMLAMLLMVNFFIGSMARE